MFQFDYFDWIQTAQLLGVTRVWVQLEMGVVLMALLVIVIAFEDVQM